MTIIRRPHQSSRWFPLMLALAIALPAFGSAAADVAPSVQSDTTESHTLTAEEAAPFMTLGAGDEVSIQVYGRPELTTTTYVSDAGTVAVPLAGAVAVAGLSPVDAAQRVALALREGQILIAPQVSLVVSQFRSQQVSVLGEVKSPARFPIQARTTVFDLLAQAGGVTDNGADVIYLLRPDGDGSMTRHSIDLKGLTDSRGLLATLTPKGGDVLYVPRANQFFIYGEVQAPNMYRLEQGMTVLQAISRGGGLTPRGSDSRIEIKRRSEKGTYRSFGATLNDELLAGDVLYVKERLF